MRLVVNWKDGQIYTMKSYYCGSPQTVTWVQHSVAAVVDNCDSRVWLHQYDNGAGTSVCVDKSNQYPPLASNPATTMWQFEETLNQAPCNGGASPY
jgi:hypothetical protein